MPYQEIEDTNIYQLAERIADAIWNTVMKWDVFPKDTVGTQIVRAADSIGANMAESSGRLHPADVVNFLYYSRGSLRQTMFFLRRAKARKLIDYHAYEELRIALNDLSAKLGGFIKSKRLRIVRADRTHYTIKPPSHQATKPPSHQATKPREAF